MSKVIQDWLAALPSLASGFHLWTHLRDSQKEEKPVCDPSKGRTQSSTSSFHSQPIGGI